MGVGLITKQMNVTFGGRFSYNKYNGVDWLQWYFQNNYTVRKSDMNLDVISNRKRSG